MRQVHTGRYMQGRGGIIIGDYTQIPANVGIISDNDDVYHTRHHASHASSPSLQSGAYGWIGMNAMILRAVELGDCTEVGAGAMVSKSPGSAVLAGKSARMARP